MKQQQTAIQLLEAADASLRRHRRRAVSFFALTMLAVLTLLAGVIADEYRRYLDSAFERTGARAGLVAEWLSGTFMASSLALGHLAEFAEQLPESYLSEAGRLNENLEHLLQSRRARYGFIEELAVYDAQGELIISSSTHTPRGFVIRGLPQFKQLQSNPALNQLVSPLQWSAFTRSYQILHVKRLDHSETLPGGLVAVSLNPTVFLSGMEELALAEGEGIAIFDTDMRLVARRSSSESTVSSVGGALDEPAAQAFLAGGEKYYRMRMASPFDGVERLYTLQRVNGLPFAVVAGEEVTVALAGWSHRLWARSGGYILFFLVGLWSLRYYLQKVHLSQEMRIATVALDSHMGMLITDAAGRILKVNQAFTTITGYREAEVLGRSPHLLSSGRHDAQFYRKLWEALTTEGAWQGEIWNRRKTGEVYPQWLTISGVENSAGQSTHYVATFSDITDKKAAEHDLHHLAFHDALTGLPNRRLLLDRLDMVLKEIPRSEQLGALMCLDLDHFKSINDLLGHAQGDTLLQQAAERLAMVLRETDTLARLSGDQFAVLLHGLGPDPEHAAYISEQIANKLLQAVRIPVQAGEASRVLTGSIGITMIDESRSRVDSVLQQAEAALAQAKAAGCDRACFFDPAMQARLQLRARLEADLHKALENQEFQVHYQPQVDASGRVTGYEGLLRWFHPERGMVSPAEFIPLAEKNGMIVPIGKWVLEEACQLLASWADTPELRSLTISVNVSPQQFLQSDFVETVLTVLERTAANPQQLKLEVTESLFVDDVARTREKMLRLRDLGIRFALDDFGTGYSSLMYLKQLPLDQLKIDQSFVRDLLDNESSQAIVQSTIALCRGLKLEAIAEGVETPWQREWLLANACGAFQGYLFGRPQPVDRLQTAQQRQ